jgi:rubrerythrin
LNGGSVPTTEQNLLAAAEGENEEHTSMYPEFEKIAREEGFNEIADLFKEIAEVEEAHEKRYRKLLANVTNKTVFKKAQPVKWKCRNCGYIHEGARTPRKVPRLCPPERLLRSPGGKLLGQKAAFMPPLIIK